MNNKVSSLSIATVLIIDDILTNLGVAVSHLEARGYRVVIAQEGEEGLQRAIFVQPDLILLDVLLPDENGFSVCRRLKADERTRGIPVVFMTALCEEEDKLNGFRAGGVDYITKPLRIDEMMARVDSQIMLRRMQKQIMQQNELLQLHQQELEQRIARRTAELTTSNLLLKEEIIERQRAQMALQESEKQYRSLVENIPDTIARYDKNCRCIFVNPKMIEELGGDLSRIFSSTPSELSSGRHAVDYQNRIAQVFVDGKNADFELSWKTIKGKQIVSYIRLVPEFDSEGNVTSVLSVGRDISEIDEYRHSIHHLTFYDTLTDLPNRALLIERMQASKYGQNFGLMILDLDRFKEINDMLGRRMADKLLCSVADRLLQTVHIRHTVARLGGDEFAILLPQLHENDDMMAIANDIVSAFEQPFRVASREVFVSTSLGMAMYPRDSADIHTLFCYADSAMYHAKKLGRNHFQFYEKELTERTSDRIELETALRRARSNDELELYYQPQIELDSGHILGAEALIRWNRKEAGFVTPDKFIPIAESSGLIISIGEWILKTACQAAVEWNKQRQKPLVIAINLSSRQFLQNDLLTTVQQTLEETGCKPEWLKLEITESLLLNDNDEVLQTLKSLDAMGLALAIDDFGTGYSALSYLNRFPMRQIKIDRSFIHDIPDIKNKAELVKAMIYIAQALHLELVAEGVETEKQADYLKQQGCQAAQGYLFGKPMPHSEFETWLANADKS